VASTARLLCSLNGVALAVCTTRGRPLRIRSIDMPAALRCQYQNFTQADMRKLYRAGLPQPPTGLEAGVQQFLAAYSVRLPRL
jgi:ADP-L-glycero-D-manno-heptose 6-epimerase